jgi:uncharacterized surface protein with fasciclin (FAS1) repeats
VNDAGDNAQDRDIVASAANAGNFATLTNALKAAGLVGTYKGVGPFTFFAPTDEAFAKLPKGMLDGLLKDRAKLASILNAHVLPGAVLAHDLVARDSMSVQGEPLHIAANDSGFTVNGARVSKREIEASNGVIHPIDKVMMPKSP